jgi:hypothetical protein
MNMTEQPIAIQVSDNGDLTISRAQVAALGLREGERLLLIPVQPDQFLLLKIDVPDEISVEQVGQMMRHAFHQTGYTSRDQIIHLVREVKQDMAQEW